MRLLQIRVLGVVAVYTQGWDRLGEMKLVFRGGLWSGLMREMASVAAGVERRVAAAFVGHMKTYLVAPEAKILFLVAGGRFQQLILVGTTVRVVAAETVAHRRWMDRTFDITGLLIRVAGEAKTRGRGSDQLNVRGLFVDTNFVTTQAAQGHGRMYGLALRFVVVALEAFRRVRVLVERDWMNGTECACEREQEERQGHPDAALRVLGDETTNCSRTAGTIIGQNHKPAFAGPIATKWLDRTRASSLAIVSVPSEQNYLRKAY